MEGWIKVKYVYSNGESEYRWGYVKNGNPYTGWIASGSDWYYIGVGIAVRGWQSIGGKYYIFNL